MGYNISKIPPLNHQVTKEQLIPGMVIATDHVTLPAIGVKKGNFLLSYILDPFVDPAFDGKNNGWGHTNVWECYTIATILQNLDFEVDVIDYRNIRFEIKKEYSFFLDITTLQQKLVSKYNMKIKKNIYLTTASDTFNNNAELYRVAEFEKDKQTYYQPKRLLTESALFDRSLNIADELLLLGNDWTKSTYPEKYHQNITLLKISAALTYCFIHKIHNAKINNENEVILLGTGVARREFLYSDDAATASIFLMHHYNDSEIINLGSGQEVTINDLASKIKSVIGFNGTIKYDGNVFMNGTPRKLVR